MSTKENVKNEVEEIKSAAAKKEIESKINAPSSDFEEIDAFSWRSDDTAAGDVNGQETVYSNTGIKLQRRIEDGKNGQAYHNFAVAFSVTLNGKKLVQSAYFNPVVRNTPMYQLLDAIFGEEEYHSAEIVKTVTPKTDSRPETVRYSLRVSSKSEFGNKVICNLTPINRGDSMVFSNLIDLLKARGLIG